MCIDIAYGLVLDSYQVRSSFVLEDYRTSTSRVQHDCLATVTPQQCIACALHLRVRRTLLHQHANASPRIGIATASSLAYDLQINAYSDAHTMPMSMPCDANAFQTQ